MALAAGTRCPSPRHGGQKARQACAYVPLEALDVLDPTPGAGAPPTASAWAKVMFRGKHRDEGLTSEQAVDEKAFAGGGSIPATSA